MKRVKVRLSVIAAIRGPIVGSSGTCTTHQPTLINLQGVHSLLGEVIAIPPG